MKRAELLKHATCSLCSKPIGNTGLPLFWKVTIERYGVDLPAVRRQDALGTFVGSQILGAVMGPDEDLGIPLMDKPAIATVCETCGTGKPAIVAILAEVGLEAAAEQEGNHGGD